MSWSYRIIKTESGCGIYEVYTDDHAKEIISYTAKPIFGGHYSCIRDLQQDLAMILKDSFRPALTKKDLPKG